VARFAGDLVNGGRLRPYGSGGALEPILASWDFTVLPAGEQASMPTGLTFTRASGGYTVRTGSSTVVQGLTASDRARVGRTSDAHNLALILEHASTNRIIRPNEPSTAIPPWITAGTSGMTWTTGQSDPAGGTEAWRIQNTTGTICHYQNTTSAFSTGQALTASLWVREGSAGGLFQLRLNQGGGLVAVGGSAGSVWRRVRATFVAIANAVGQLVPSSGQVLTANGGIAAGARDAICWNPQVELGRIATEHITTTTAAVTREAEHMHADDGAALSSGGRVSMAVRLRPKGAPTDYLANPRLWTLDASNYCEVNATTGAVVVVIGGAAYTTASAATWAADDLVDLWVEAGGGTSNTVVKYRVNEGAAATLGTSASPQGSVTPAGPLDLCCNSTANQFTSRIETIAFYRSGQAPAWAA
jgi:hypothetical protein